MSHVRRALFLLAFILPLLLIPSQAQAHSVTWSRTFEHMDWRTASKVVRVTTHRYDIRHAGTVVGYWTSTVRKSPHVVVKTRFPVFRTVPPAGRTISAWITGYTWGHGAYGNPGSSGIMPFVGMVSSDVYPPHTRIYVPSLGYYGVVLDSGVGTGGFDLFEPTYAACLAITGEREVVVY